MSTSIKNAFIKRSLNMPKGVGYGARSRGKVKKSGSVVVPKQGKSEFERKTSRMAAEMAATVKRKKKKAQSDGNEPKKSEVKRGAARDLDIKKIRKRTRQGV